RRHFVPHEGGFLIMDSWSASSPVTATIQWLTLASPEGNAEAVVLHQGGKELHLECEGTGKVTIRIDHIERPARSFDAPNPGLARVSFECRAASGSMELRVRTPSGV